MLGTGIESRLVLDQTQFSKPQYVGYRAPAAATCRVQQDFCAKLGCLKKRPVEKNWPFGTCSRLLVRLHYNATNIGGCLLMGGYHKVRGGALCAG